MKTRALWFALGLLACGLSSRAEIIAQWNFNGSSSVSCGQGTARLIGGTTATFASGSTNDPASTGNQGWNLSHFPSQGTSNKLAGVQFDVSTLGYSGIAVRWDHRVSSTASKYCRLQYSPDGVQYFDYPTPTAANAVSSTSSYYEPQLLDLSWLAGVDNNPNFSMRIVTEFVSTAVGYGADQYATTYGTNTYGTSGTIRLDMVTVTGTPIPGENTPPRISSVPDQTLRVYQSSAGLAVTVSDFEDWAENLVVEASSSDPAVVPGANISLTGWGADRWLIVTAGSEPGLAVLTLTVTDSGGRSSSTTFTVNVLPANTPPVLSTITATNCLSGMMVGPLDFTVGDLESPADMLSVSAISLNPSLLPNDSAHISFGGFDSNRTVTLMPVAGQAGVAPVRLTVSDGSLTSTSVFSLMVRPSDSLLLYEPFAYSDGSLLTNSGLLWDNRSGTRGECQVSAGQLQIASTQTEDVEARLAGAPWVRGNSIAIYSSFKIKFIEIPKLTGDYFAHLVGGSALRARVFARAAISFPGGYHLLISNGSTTNVEHFAALSTNTTYQVVMRYDIDTATSKLWVNPASENASAATATDVQSPVSITSFGFRQSSGLGATVLVDDLRVGLSFAAVTEATDSGSIPLRIERAGQAVVLRWDDPAFVLQASPWLAGPFTNVAGASSPYAASMRGTSCFFRLHRGP